MSQDHDLGLAREIAATAHEDPKHSAEGKVEEPEGHHRILTNSHDTRSRAEIRVLAPFTLDTSSERAALVAAVLRLPVLERDALVMTVWEGLDQRECARVLGCSRIAIALRLRRARARLRVDRSLALTPRLIPKDTR